MKDKLITIVLIIVLILPLIVGVYENSNKKEENNSNNTTKTSTIFLNKKQRTVINYLKEKYGDGDWKIVEEKENKYKNQEEVIFRGYIKDGYIYTVSSSYLNGETFKIYLNSVNMITTDCFLPTYYSIKYNLEYSSEKEEYDELIDKMVYLTEYHYPYNDDIYNSSGWYFQKPYHRITSFTMESFYHPISIQESPNKEKTLDIIPSNQSIPDITEIIDLVEQFYSSERKRNTLANDEEFYNLFFKNNIEEQDIIDYISNHITPVDGLEILKKYRINE